MFKRMKISLTDIRERISIWRSSGNIEHSKGKKMDLKSWVNICGKNLAGISDGDG